MRRLARPETAPVARRTTMAARGDKPGKFDPPWFAPGLLVLVLSLAALAAVHHWGDRVLFGTLDTRDAAGLWAAAFALYMVVAVHEAKRNKALDLERRMRGQCPACGYDLRASPGRCPECGTAAANAQFGEGGRGG